MATPNDAKAKLAAEMAKKPKPKPGKGSITNQVTSKYGKDYGNTPSDSKKFNKMANDSRFN